MRSANSSFAAQHVFRVSLLFCIIHVMAVFLFLSKGKVPKSSFLAYSVFHWPSGTDEHRKVPFVFAWHPPFAPYNELRWHLFLSFRSLNQHRPAAWRWHRLLLASAGTRHFGTALKHFSHSCCRPELFLLFCYLSNFCDARAEAIKLGSYSDSAKNAASVVEMISRLAVMLTCFQTSAMTRHFDKKRLLSHVSVVKLSRDKFIPI